MAACGPRAQAEATFSTNLLPHLELPVPNPWFGGYAVRVEERNLRSKDAVPVASDSISTSRPPVRTGGTRLLASLSLNIGSAMESLLGNLFRASLTVLGVVIGVAAVIILVAF